MSDNLTINLGSDLFGDAGTREIIVYRDGSAHLKLNDETDINAPLTSENMRVLYGALKERFEPKGSTVTVNQTFNTPPATPAEADALFQRERSNQVHNEVNPDESPLLSRLLEEIEARLGRTGEGLLLPVLKGDEEMAALNRLLQREIEPPQDAVADAIDTFTEQAVNALDKLADWLEERR